MQHRHITIRDTLVVLLTLTTGVVDAACFLALGQVFSSVITGNLVLLGIAAGRGTATLAVHSGVALGGYSLGVALGAPIAARRHDGPAHGTGTWPSSVTLTLIAELCVLAAFTVWWELVAGRPGANTQLGLVVLLGAAMGIQSAATRRLGQMSSTYLTSTLTGVVAWLTTHDRPDAVARSIGALTAIVVGALLGAVVVKTVPVLIPLVMLLPLCTVIGVSLAGFHWVREHVLGSRVLPGRGR